VHFVRKGLGIDGNLANVVIDKVAQGRADARQYFHDLRHEE
jgi:hypothetical protein